LPDTPTFTELGYDIVAENWLGFSAPAGVPDAIKTSLDAALQKAMAEASVMAQFDTWGLVREPKTSAEFEAFVAEQFEAWKPLVTAVSN
jgi:tripartite-type tricarboxylate transporter receptor subunit TctC